MTSEHIKHFTVPVWIRIHRPEYQVNKDNRIAVTTKCTLSLIIDNKGIFIIQLRKVYTVLQEMNKTEIQWLWRFYSVSFILSLTFFIEILFPYDKWHFSGFFFFTSQGDILGVVCTKYFLRTSRNDLNKCLAIILRKHYRLTNCVRMWVEATPEFWCRRSEKLNNRIRDLIYFKISDWRVNLMSYFPSSIPKYSDEYGMLEH